LKISGYAEVKWEKTKKIKETPSKKSKVDEEIQIGPKKTKETVEKYVNREDYISTTNYFIGSDDGKMVKFTRLNPYNNKFVSFQPHQIS